MIEHLNYPLGAQERIRKSRLWSRALETGGLVDADQGAFSLAVQSDVAVTAVGADIAVDAVAAFGSVFGELRIRCVGASVDLDTNVDGRIGTQWGTHAADIS